MDSDRRNEGDGINATKSRVMAELAGDPSGMTWLTAGREIENYVPHELMAAAVGQVTTRSIDYAGGRYEQVIPVGGTPRVDKLKVAREVVVRWSNQTVGLHDLEATITSLAGRIAAANGMSTTPT